MTRGRILDSLAGIIANNWSRLLAKIVFQNSILLAFDIILLDNQLRHFL